MDEKLSLNDYDIKKIKEIPGVQTKIKYIPEKDLWVFERVETTFIRGAYMRKIQEANNQKVKDNFSEFKKNVLPVKGKFDDIE